MKGHPHASFKLFLYANLLSFAIQVVGAEIHTAAGAGDVGKLRELLQGDPALVNLADTNQATPLHYAARMGQGEAVQVLISAGANLELLNKDKHSPLCCALHNGQVETGTMLLERGGRFSEPDAWGWRPLHLAVRGRQTRLIELLLDKGADANGANPTNGITPLHAAVVDGQVEIARCLLEHNADFNTGDGNGDTALHVAARAGKMECAELLVAKGANPNAANRMGFRPVDLVAGRKNDRLADFLQQRTATRWESARTGKVGEVGDPSLLIFEGNASFSDKAIRSALSTSASYLLAAHPQAELRSFLSALEQKVMGGYQVGGFPDPEISATYNDRSSQVRVKISEGQRRRCGLVKITGTDRRIAATLHDRLTKWPRRAPQSPSWIAKIGNEKEATDGGQEVEIKVEWDSDTGLKDTDEPLWEPGHPARFDPNAIEAIRMVARTCLAEYGFWFPTVRIERPSNPGGGTTDLELNITPGPPGKIVEIDLSGNRRNSRAEILNFLRLCSGKTVTRELLSKVHSQLWNSARFLDWTISAQPVPAVKDPSGGICLKLAVREYEPAPKLIAKLTREEQALVKCADWLGRFKTRPEDLVASISEGEHSLFGAKGSVVLSPNRGALIKYEPAQAGAPAYSFLFAERLMGVYALNQKYKFETKDPNLLTDATVQVLPASAGSTNLWYFHLGGSFHQVPELAAEGGSTPPFQIKPVLPPVAFLSLAQDHLMDCKWQGRMLAIVTSNLTLRVDARTGRVHEMSSSGVPSGSIRFEKGAFMRARKELTQSASGHANRYLEDRLLGSLLTFALRESVRLSLLKAQGTNLNLSPQLDGASRALDKIVGNDLFASLIPLGDASATNEVFKLPLDDIDYALARNNLAAMYSGLAFHYCDQLFPKYSWPWTVARESVFVLASQGRYVNEELRRLGNSADTGPIGSLAIAWLLQGVDASAAKAFALRGLARLRAEDFQKDCGLVLKGDAGLARGFAALARNLQNLTDQDIEALSIALTPADFRFLKQASDALRANPSQPLAVSLGPVLEEFWNTRLQQLVRAELQAVAFSRKDRTQPSHL